MGQTGGMVPGDRGFPVNSTSQHTDSGSETTLDRERLAAALEQLYLLLEEYSPAWYTERLHEQSEAALKPYSKP